jgi:hypothetical protein
MVGMPGAPTTTAHDVIAPVGPVAKEKNEAVPLRLVSVCTPSDNEKAVGNTWVDGMFGASGPANVTIAVTNMLVVYGPLTLVKGLPVYWYVVGTA